MSHKDYYATLGVLPNAEDVVIRAAYKALAQRYHPDRYEGDSVEATRRMAEINEAYSILSDPLKRKEYDENRRGSAQSGEEYFSEDEAEAKNAYDPLEKDWSVAARFYPDLPSIEKRLEKIARRLAFTFRAYMLEAKLFDKRMEVADAMERSFLEIYFGTNPATIAFAKELIESGNKRAAKSLNEAIRVLGPNANSKLVISAIRSEIREERSPNYSGKKAGTAPDYQSAISFLSMVRNELGTEGLEKVKNTLNKMPNLVLGSDSDGNTPLHIAVDEKKRSFAKVLLDFGADPLLKNNGGISPLDLARKRNYEQMIELLQLYE
jgi:curved DNA-binding protein CbpA